MFYYIQVHLLDHYTYHEIRFSVYLRKSDRFVLKTHKWPNLRKQDSLTDGNYCAMTGCHMSKRNKI
jgi:hypothetical protein